LALRGKIMAPYHVRRLFIGGSKHGQFERVPDSESSQVEFPVFQERTIADLMNELTGPLQPYRQTFVTERYEAKKIGYRSPTGLRIDAIVMVAAGHRRYISGVELHAGFATWAIDMLLFDAGLSTVRPPGFPL
jgi:hypothetical protein